MTDIVVDEEFQALLPPQTAEEHAELEAKLLAEGCADAIAVWSGKNILLDGHHRYALCKRHNIPFRVRFVKLADRDDALRWIVTTQLARRNLTHYQRAELVLRLKPELKTKARENMVKGKKGLPFEPCDVNGEMAKMSGLDRNFVWKAGFVAERVDDATKAKLRSGDTSVNTEYKRLKDKPLEDSKTLMIRFLQSALEAIRSYDAPSGMPPSKVVDHLQNIAAKALEGKALGGSNP